MWVRVRPLESALQVRLLENDVAQMHEESKREHEVEGEKGSGRRGCRGCGTKD